MPVDECSARQRWWDAPGISRDWTTIWINCVKDIDKATSLKAAHSSDWLFALPISSCGLRMCDETIRVPVGLRLGLNLCEAQTCPYGALVSARGTHGLSCKSTGDLLVINRSTILFGEP